MPAEQTHAALIRAHRAAVEGPPRWVLNGLRGEALVAEAKAVIRRAYARLDRGLGDYAVRK